MLKEEELHKVRKSFIEAKDRMSFVLEASVDPTRVIVFRLLSKQKC